MGSVQVTGRHGTRGSFAAQPSLSKKGSGGTCRDRVQDLGLGSRAHGSKGLRGLGGPLGV